MRMPRVRLVVALSAFAAASLERASTLEEWLGAMTLDPGVDFETTIAGTSLEITDLTCEDLKITGALAAAYEAPRALRRRGRGDLFGLLLDVGARLGLPLASEEALDLGGLGVATVGGAGPERARLAVSVADAPLTAALGARAARGSTPSQNAGDDGRDGRGLQLAGPSAASRRASRAATAVVLAAARRDRPLRSAVAVSDVFLANAASIDDVRAFPRGADSLLDATTVELLSLRAGFGRGPVVGGATLTFDTPFGARPASSGRSAARAYSARSSASAARPRARAAGAAELVEDAVGAAVAVVGRYVDPAAARREALWLANDAFHDFLARSKRTCVRKRPGAGVAPRVDARGDRPAAAAANDPSGAEEAPEPRADAGHRSLMADAPVPGALKVALLVILLGNGALLATSNVALAAEIRARVHVDLAGRAETLWVDAGSKFSLAESVGKLWDARSYALAILIAALSGAWPYAELGCLLWGYCARGVPPARRESVFKTVEMLSKWSFIDVFIVVLLVVACHVGVAVDARTASLELDVFVEMRYAFYAFCLATRCVAPAAAAVAALLCAGLTLEFLTFDVGGAAGLLQDLADRGSDARDYDARPRCLEDATPDDGWRPCARCRRADARLRLFRAAGEPRDPRGALGAAAAPGGAGEARRGERRDLRLVVADVAVAVVATGAQLGDLVDALAKKRCKQVDGVLGAFFDAALEGDATCLAVRCAGLRRPRVAPLHALLGYLASHATTAAVAERVAAGAGDGFDVELVPDREAKVVGRPSRATATRRPTTATRPTTTGRARRGPRSSRAAPSAL
ncbi:oxidoreductase [Aureococcus anophagefferens]|nr:oxidoreductase [Aureococcus anophagefferens]